MPFIIIGGLIAIFVIWGIGVQRRLVAMDENVNNAMSQIGVQLSSRFDALTALLDLTKGYAILQAGAIDLAVVDGGFDAEGFNSILLDTDYFVAAVANDNPLAQKSIIYLSDLRSERLILRTPGSGTRDLFEAHLQSVGIQLAIFKI